MIRKFRVCPSSFLFALALDGTVKAWSADQGIAMGGNKAFKVNKYYHTEWMPEHELNLKIEGLNMDAVWENLIIQVGGVEVGQGKSLDEQIQIDDQKTKMQKEIEKLEKQARNEKQPNKKFQLAQHVKELKRQVENLQ